MENTSNARKEGFYWVKYRGQWIIAHWEPAYKEWFTPGDDRHSYDAEFEEINETPIEREEWLPIETAPKDGTFIWGWDKMNGQYSCHWSSYAGGIWELCVSFSREGDDYVYPTHFRPLPEAPKPL